MLHENVPDVSSRQYGLGGPFGAGRVLLASTGVLVAVMFTVYAGLKGRVSQTKIILSQDLLGIIYGGKIVETTRPDLARTQVLERSATSLDEKTYPDKKPVLTRKRVQAKIWVQSRIPVQAKICVQTRIRVKTKLRVQTRVPEIIQSHTHTHSFIAPRCYIHLRWCLVVLFISFVQIISCGHMDNYVSNVSAS